MKRTYKALLLSTFMIFGIYSCSLSTNTSDTKIKASKPENSKGLVGKAVFPASRKQESNFRIKNHGFKTKATATDIGSVSTISVITLTQNKTVATGLTDTLGNFQIDMSKVTLAVNDIYILEALKRTGEDVETIRTYIRWNGTTWDSITVGDVLINENTTAISIIAGFLNTPTLDLIGKIDPANLTDIFDSTNTTVLISKLDIVNVAKLVTSVLLGERDPIALIKYDALKPYKYYIDQVYNYNQISTTGGCSGCSFIGADLSNPQISLAGKDLSSADLRGQDLSQKNLTETKLVNADLRGAILPLDLSYLNLSGANLSGQDLRNKIFDHSVLSGADLTSCNLSGISGALKDWSKVILNQVNLTGASLEYCKLDNLNMFESIFINSRIKGSSFNGTDLTGVDLSQIYDTATFNLLLPTNLDKPNFTNANLTASNLTNLNVAGSINNANLESAILKGSTLSSLAYPLDLSYKNLSGTNFTGADLRYAKVIGANFRNSNFSAIDLGNGSYQTTKLGFIDFSNVNLSNINFYKADFRGKPSPAKFSGTNFTGANLNSSIFEPVMTVEKTNFTGADLRGATLRYSIVSCDFSYANMSGLNLSQIPITPTGTVKRAALFIYSTFKHTNFYKTIFSTNISGADNAVLFTNCDLRDQILSEVNSENYYYEPDLSLIVYSYKNFSGCGFKNSDLSTTIMKNSFFGFTNFTGATTPIVGLRSGANFGSALWNDGSTLCPNNGYTGLCGTL